MSWEDHVKGFQRYGATMGGIYSYAGDVWGQVGMDATSKQEVEGIVASIRSGNRQMSVNGRGCVVTNINQGHSITGKAKPQFEGDTDRPLYHAILGKTNCVYIAGCLGSNERCVVETLEKKFEYLQQY